MSGVSRRGAAVRLAIGLLIIVAGTVMYLRLGRPLGLALGASYVFASFWWGWFTLRRIFPPSGRRYSWYATGDLAAFLMVLVVMKWAVIGVACGFIGVFSQPVECALCVWRIARDRDAASA